MAQLLLSGRGDSQDSHLLDQLLVHLTTRGRMLYLPIAIDPQQTSYASCYQWIRSVFTPSGLDITMWDDISAKTIHDLRSFATLYIGGGNTFKLLHDLKQAQFDKTIQHFLQRGGIVYGGSAGAIVCGKDISTALFDPNDVGLEDTAGLDLLQGASVWCHYESAHDQHILSAVERLQQPIIALSEKTGLYMQNMLMLAVGFEPVVVFQQNGQRIFPPSSVVLLT